MALAFDKAIKQSESGEALVPVEVSQRIIETLPKASVVLSCAPRTVMSSKTTRQPVLASLPEASFVDASTGLMGTAAAKWENVNLEAEEIGCIIPVPNALLQDASINLFDAITPHVVAAIGRAVDAAALFGKGKPSSWPDGLLTKAKTVHTVEGKNAPTKTDLDIIAATEELCLKMAENGQSPTGFLGAPGTPWKIKKANRLSFQDSIAEGVDGVFLGKNFLEVNNGSWDAATGAIAAVDWASTIVGIRQDVTFTMSDQATLVDGSGKVMNSLFQRNHTALRFVMRVGFQYAAPANPVADGKAKCPAGVVTLA